MADVSMMEAALSWAARGMAVLPLHARSKKPATTHGFKDATANAESIAEWWAVHPDDNIGIACGEMSDGLMVIDLDSHEDADGADYLAEWEAEHGELPDTLTVRTGSGGTHLLYRVTEEVRPSVNESIAVDIRGDGSYIVAPPSVHPVTGMRYEVAHDAPIAYADARVMEFVRSARPTDFGSREKFRLPEGGATPGTRDETIFRMACSLQSQGMPDDVIYSAVRSYNASLPEPLPEAQADQKVRSALRYEKGERRDEVHVQDASADRPAAKPRSAYDFRTSRGAIKHNVLARMLIDCDHMCFIDGMPAVWNDGRYHIGWDEVDRVTLAQIDSIKHRDQREVHHYLHLMAPRVHNSRATLVGFTNCIVDVETGEPREYTHDDIMTNIIPHAYDMGAKDPTVDHVLERMACGDETTLYNLYEVIGVCLYRSAEFGQCPVLLGSGSNGKSTFIKMLRAVLGDSNVSALDLSTIGKPFQAGRLMGKLANLGDDISNEFVKGEGLAVFKKVVTGDWVYTDVKGGDGYEFKPYCTVVLSANDMPKLGDSSEGMMRRLFPIEFNAHFSPDDPDFDPRIVEKVTSPSACQYLCRLGLVGLARVIANNSFTPNEASTRTREEIREENSTVIQWLNDEDMTAESLTGRTTLSAFEDYCRWCERSRVYPVSRIKFTRQITGTTLLKSALVRDPVAGKKMRTFVLQDGDQGTS